MFRNEYRNGSHRVQKGSVGLGDRFILTDFLIIYTRFGSSQPPVSLEITTIASLIRETSAIIPKKVTEKGDDLFIKYLSRLIFCGFLPPRRHLLFHSKTLHKSTSRLTGPISPEKASLIPV